MRMKYLKISYTEHKNNLEVLYMVEESRSLKKDAIKRKLQYCGHLMRRSGLQKKLIDEGWYYQGVDKEELQSNDLAKTEGLGERPYPTFWWSWIPTCDR